MSWINAAYKLGVTAVIALGLAWFLVDDIKTSLVESRVAHAAMAADMQKQLTIDGEIKIGLERIQRTLIAMCINAAPTNEARSSCVQ